MSYRLGELECKLHYVKGGRVRRVRGSTGRLIKNQWFIETDRGVFFQSYNSIIAYRLKGKSKLNPEGQVWLDRALWDCSTTTARYRRLFLGEGIEETRNKIKSGEYKVFYLNTYEQMDEDYIEKLV